MTLSDISATLTPASGTPYFKYKVVCLLSTSEGTPAAGPLTKEPDWDLEYTFSFTELVTLNELITQSDLSNASVDLDLRSAILQKFNTTGATFMQSWFNKWYVADNNGNKHTLQYSDANNRPLSGTWVHSRQDYTTSNNETFMSSSTHNEGWYWDQNNVGVISFYAPSGKTFEDYQKSKFVLEASDSYDGTTATPKVIWYIPIPSASIFEFNGTPTNTAITQTLDSRTDVSTVTLDWTGTKTSPAITSTGYKYARFYVVDQSGTPVSPTDNAHKLTVNGGTACVKATSGYYVYNGGSDITLPTVTLSCTGGDVRDYSVVCWLATTTDNINATGNDVAEEPDIDVSYTYSFVKPALTETVYKTGTIAWGASMQADATAGAPADWGTTWAELSREQRVVWYITDGTTKQQLSIGTAAQANTWTLNLPNVFSITSNEAVLTGQTSFTATEWAIWGKPTIYAPTGMTFADGHSYQVVCEVYESATGTTPNVRYTFFFTKDFLGELKSGVTATTVPVVLADASATSYELTGITLPSGAKYARFYLTDGTGTPVDPTGKLTVSGTTSTVSGHADYGYYIYNESGITTPTVTLTLTDATLNQYRVVMVASADNAVTEGGAVVNEPDWDAQTTWTFKYPVSHTEATGTVEWSPVSMTVPLNIDTHKGSGYLSTLTDYHVVWTVEDGSGNAQALTTGTERQAGTWTYSVSGTTATFYAPSDTPFADVQNMNIVARLYETATGENDADKSLTYTVSITRTEFLGTLKGTGNTDSETVTLEDGSAATVDVPLSHATLSGAKYARVWLTQGGTMVSPAGKLSVPTGMNAFGTNHDATYGYYLYDENGITLGDVTLSAPGSYTDYQVHVALSVDAPFGYNAFARADAPRRATSLTAYEPDYDYEYTISYQDNSMKVIKIYVQASEGASNGNAFSTSTNIPGSTDSDTRSLLQRINAAFTDMSETLNTDNCFAKWVVLDENGDPLTLGQHNPPTGGIQLGGIEGACYHSASDNKAVYAYKNQSWDTSAINGKLNATLTFANGVYQLGKVIELWVTNENNQTAADPADGYKVKVEVHFTEDGNPPYPLLNETDIAATKKMVNVKTLNAAAPVFDMTDALVANAKYARFYLMKRGSVNAASEDLTVTYNGNPATDCESPYSRFGHYLSEAGGIDPTNLVVSTNGISADDMLQYQLVVVSSANEMTGTQEPAWEKMTVISFQKDIKNRVFGNDTNRSVAGTELNIGSNTLQADVLAKLHAEVADIAGSLYAKWYVLAPDGSTVQTVDGRGVVASWNSNWGFNLAGDGSGTWQNVSNVFTLYTDMNQNVSSQTIAQNDQNGLWNKQIAKATAIYVPCPDDKEMHTLDYPGYQIVFELSDEYDTSTGGTDPGYKLRYIWTITDPSDFEGNRNTDGAEDEVTQTVTRDDASINLTLQGAPATTTWALEHEKLRGPQNHPRYARFYLTDLDGNPVDPTGKLTVTYGHDNGTVTTCSIPEHGFYIFGTNGGPLDPPEIHVSLAAPKKYMLYKVVCLFSNELEDIIPEERTLPLQREPDYDLKYTYSFAYNVETAQFNRTIDWMDYNPMDVMADLPNNDPDLDWNISWEELSASHYVSWYVAPVDMMGNLGQRQPVAIGNSRQDGTWTLDLRGLPFEVVNNNTVVATGQTTVSENSWHRWGQPDLYAPTDMTYNQALRYRLICEVAATADATPYARYTFGFLNNILGELKATGGTGTEVIHVEETATAVTVPLEHALDEYHKEHPDAKVVYVRTWLTTNDGTLVSPSPLSWSQMYNTHDQVVPFSYHTNFNWGDYGYYFGSFDVGDHHVGVTELEDGTLTLEAGTHPRYQVHVALSTDDPRATYPDAIAWNGTNSRWEFSNDQNGYGWWTQPEAHEPNYDYVYTFKFRTAFEATNINSPELKTKYKTLIYDPASNSCTPTILHNWPEVVADVTSNRTEFAQKAYVRWYLVDKATNEPIEMLEFEATAPYVSLGNEYGYYFRNFNADNLPYRDNQHHEKQKKQQCAHRPQHRHCSSP